VVADRDGEDSVERVADRDHVRNWQVRTIESHRGTLHLEARA
jgi:hypothetical protein